MAGELICRCALRTIDADLRLPLDQAAVTVLFGPSGAGKTTLLRMLAGLERPEAGEIRFSDETWFDHRQGVLLPPQKRRAGFLFQEYALFPHLSVLENVAYSADRETGMKMLRRFGLEELAGSRPRQISGGQRQRVALARALAARPSLLLLDEPLSALDAATRQRTRHELRRVLRESGIPSIVVTHDRTDAIALGDWMAVMVEGRIRRAGPLQDVFRRPGDAQVAASIGVENVLPAQVISRGGGLAVLLVGGKQLECVDTGEEAPLFACIRAEDISLSRPGPRQSSVRNHVPGRILSVDPEGPLARVELDCGFPLIAQITAQSAADLNLRHGEEVVAVIKTTSLHLAS